MKKFSYSYDYPLWKKVKTWTRIRMSTSDAKQYHSEPPMAQKVKISFMWTSKENRFGRTKESLKEFRGPSLLLSVGIGCVLKKYIKKKKRS